MKYNEDNIKKSINDYRRGAQNLISLIQVKTKDGSITDVDELKNAWGHKTDMVKILLDFEKIAVTSTQLLKAVFDMKQANQVKCVSLQEKYDELNKKFEDQADKYEKVSEYTQILDKVDEHMDTWKDELVRCVKDGVKTEINNEVKQILKDSVPDIVKSVATGVNKQTSLEEIVPKIVNEAVTKSEKKWSDFFQSNKEETKKQTLEAKKQSKIVEESIRKAKQKQAVENIERQKRVRNIVVSNVPEAECNEENEKVEHDKKYIMDCLNFTKNDVCTVYRVGILNKNSHGPRKLVAVLASPDIAKEQHNYGRGKPIYQEDKIIHWVNQDLIKEDREANFKARDLRRTRSQKKLEHGTNTTNFLK